MKTRSAIRTTAALVLIGLVSFAATPAAQAESLYRDSAEVNSMMHKLGRGLSNVLTGWLEIPKQIGKSSRETDPFTGVLVGSIKGIGWTFARTATGFFEVATFPFPVPEDYGVMIEPEFIVSDMWGEPIPYVMDKPRFKTEEDSYRPFP